MNNDELYQKIKEEQLELFYQMSQTKDESTLKLIRNKIKVNVMLMLNIINQDARGKDNQEQGE